MCKDARILRSIANCARGLLSEDQKALHGVANRIADRCEPIPDMATINRSMADCKAGRCQPIQELIDELDEAAEKAEGGDS